MPKLPSTPPGSKQQIKAWEANRLRAPARKAAKLQYMQYRCLVPRMCCPQLKKNGQKRGLKRSGQIGKDSRYHKEFEDHMVGGVRCTKRKRSNQCSIQPRAPRATHLSGWGNQRQTNGSIYGQIFVGESRGEAASTIPSCKSTAHKDRTVTVTTRERCAASTNTCLHATENQTPEHVS